MELWLQLNWGLWSTSQGWPRTTGVTGVSVKRNWIVSMWFPEVTSLRGPVEWVMEERDRPLRAWTAMGCERAITGSLSLSARSESKKLPSAPESIKAWQSWVTEDHCNLTVRSVAAREDLASVTPPVSNLLPTDGLWLLRDTVLQCAQQLRNTGKDPRCAASASPPGTDWICPSAWALVRRNRHLRHGRR